jgi:hypothetical protein
MPTFKFESSAFERFEGVEMFERFEGCDVTPSQTPQIFQTLETLSNFLIQTIFRKISLNSVVYPLVMISRDLSFSERQSYDR